jgi:hypothetical protein
MSITTTDILDFEGNTEAVFVNILRSLGLPAYASDSNEDLPIPRVDVVATLTESGPHERVLPNGERVYDQHAVQVSIIAIFAADTPDLDRSFRDFRGIMRKMAFFPTPILEAFADQGLYFAASTTIRETSGIRQVDTDEGASVAEFRLNLVLFLSDASLAILGPVSVS